MTRVLPEPAPARISSGPSRCSAASRWAGFSLSRKCMGGVVIITGLGTRDSDRNVAVLADCTLESSAAPCDACVLVQRPRKAVKHLTDLRQLGSDRRKIF